MTVEELLAQPHPPLDTLAQRWQEARRRTFLADMGAEDPADYWAELRLGTEIARQVQSGRWCVVADLLRAGMVESWAQVGEALGLTELEAHCRGGHAVTRARTRNPRREVTPTMSATTHKQVQPRGGTMSPRDFIFMLGALALAGAVILMVMVSPALGIGLMVVGVLTIIGASVVTTEPRREYRDYPPVRQREVGRDWDAERRRDR